MFSDQQRRQLQQLMEYPQWGAVEVFVQEYLTRNFIQSSSKRNTEWDTIWEIAYGEGGKAHIQAIFAQMEAEAQKV